MPAETLYTLDTHGTPQNMDVTTEPENLVQNNKVIDTVAVSNEISPVSQGTRCELQAQTGSLSTLYRKPGLIPEVTESHVQELVSSSEKSPNMLMRHLLTKSLDAMTDVTAIESSQTVRSKRNLQKSHVQLKSGTVAEAESREKPNNVEGEADAGGKMLRALTNLVL